MDERTKDELKKDGVRGYIGALRVALTLRALYARGKEISGEVARSTTIGLRSPTLLSRTTRGSAPTPL